MYKHEKQAVERLQSNHIHMLSTLSTAIIASFLIISLSGTLLFPVMAFADEPQPVAQVGNTTYMSVQDAIGHTSMKNNTVTLLTDTTESITVTPSKVVRGGHARIERTYAQRQQYHGNHRSCQHAARHHRIGHGCRRR